MRVVSFLACACFWLSEPAIADVADALRLAREQNYVASGDVLCAQEVGERLGACSASVSRAKGSAAVVVTFANGFFRILSFSDRAFLRGNTTMSGTGKDTDWRLENGVFHVRVDDQRFEIPEALVFGDAS